MKTAKLGGLGLTACLFSAGVAALADGTGVAEQMGRVVAQAKIGLAQATELARAEVAGAIVVDAELKWNRQPAYYEAELLTATQLKEARVDLASGKVLELVDLPLDQDGAVAFKAAQRAVARVKLSVSQAVDMGTKAARGGTPIAVELTGNPDRPAFRVRLLREGKVQQVLLDGVSGEVASIGEDPLPLALWTFDETSAGQMPPGWSGKQTHPSGTPGGWAVRADRAAPSRPNVLSLSTSAPKGTFNVALVENTSYKDVDARVAIRANTGEIDQGGGLVWRAKDENNYYVCRLNPLESNLRVYQVVDGKRTQLQSAELPAEAGRWYALRAVMVGDAITVEVDGHKYLELADHTLSEAGMIGLWTKADASSSFDNLAVYTPRSAPASQPAAGESRPTTQGVRSKGG